MSDSPEQVEGVVHEESVEQERHEMPPRPAVPNRGPHKSSTQIAHEVQDGQWGGEGWQERVASAGFNVDMVQRLINKGVGQN